VASKRQSAIHFIRASCLIRPRAYPQPSTPPACRRRDGYATWFIDAPMRSCQAADLDIDERDREFVDYDAGRTIGKVFTTSRTARLLHCPRRSYAPHCDLIFGARLPSRSRAGPQVRRGVCAHRHHPASCWLYNCSPSFNWKKASRTMRPSPSSARTRAMGYNIPVHHAGRFSPASTTAMSSSPVAQGPQMSAYFGNCRSGICLSEAADTPRQAPARVAPGYFDAVSWTITGGQSLQPLRWANP